MIHSRSKQRRSIAHMNVSGFILMIEMVIKDKKEELNLREDSIEGIVDWVILDLLNDALAASNINLLNHYRYDEAYIIKEAMLPSIRESIVREFKWRFERHQDTQAKAMISGNEIFISIKDSDASRL